MSWELRPPTKREYSLFVRAYTRGAHCFCALRENSIPLKQNKIKKE